MHEVKTKEQKMVENARWVLGTAMVGLLVAGLPGPPLVPTGAGWSAVLCPMAWAEEFKVGYVDTARVFDEYERTKRSESILGRKGKQKEGELEKRFNELKKMREGLDLLSAKARENRARELEVKADELKRFGKFTKRDLLMERDRVAQEIVADIRQAIQDYASDNGFSLILDERLILFGQELYDVTDEVVRHLNARDMARAKRR